jgi:serine/threonine protein kinase
LNFIHKANVIHRDLKPSNILVTTNCTIKIADFGLSRTIDDDDDGLDRSRALSPVCFTRYYRPPEVILQQKSYDFSADVWSLGCLIFELFKHSTMTEKQLKKQKSKIAFQGGSCFPISPVPVKDLN